MNKSVFIILLTNLLVFVLCDNVSFEDCGSTYELEEVYIDGCDRFSICVMTTQDVVNVSALITASSQASSNLVHQATLVLNSIHTPLTVSPDACAASTCPIQSSTQTTYSARFTMPTSIALNTRGYMEWKITNNFNSLIVCFRVNIETRSRFYNFLERLLKMVRRKD